MELTRCDILCISFLLLLARGFAQSPCPDYFEYRQDDSGIYGIVHVYPRQRVTSIEIKITFTVATRLTSNYLGKIQPQGDNLALIQQFNRGVPIDYRLHFPVTSPLPRITSIIANNDLLCSSGGDVALPNQYVTRVNLAHMLYLKSGEPVYEDAPTRPPNIFNGNNNVQDYSAPLPNGNFVQPVKVEQTTPWWIQQAPQTLAPPTQAPPVITTPKKTAPAQPVQSHNSLQCGVKDNGITLVWGGKGYRRGFWPWVVAIFKRKDIGNAYVCSGTLVSNRHAISAAHCIYMNSIRTSIRHLHVEAGVHNLLDVDEDGIIARRAISAAYIPDNYNSTTFENDILMLTFKREIEFNVFIKPACIWNKNTDQQLIVGQSGVVAGWGLSESGPAGEGEPTMTRMTIVSRDECRSSNPKLYNLTFPTTLCAGERDGKGPCLGDSGGGLYVFDNGHWRLRAIVSVALVSNTGDKPCNLDEYVVFTDAAQFLPWIEERMRE